MDDNIYEWRFIKNVFIYKWRFIKKFSTSGGFNSRCNLCLEEKISIIRYKFANQLLNKRNHLIFKCRHKDRFKLMIKVNNRKIDNDNHSRM